MQRVRICLPQTLKVNTTIKGSSGKMAIFFAAETGKWDIVDILVSHGADINVKGEIYIQSNFQKLTPLLQVPPVKHLFLQQSKAIWTLSSCSLKVVLMWMQNSVRHIFNIILKKLRPPLQVPLVKQHLCLQQREESGTLLPFSLSMMLM